MFWYTDYLSARLASAVSGWPDLRDSEGAEG